MKAIGGLVTGGPKVIVEGRVRSVEIRPVEQNCVFECTVDDDTGALIARFYGRTGIPGVGPEPGSGWKARSASGPAAPS